MPVIEDHPPFGLGISASYAGDRGAERLVLEPHDHLHNKQSRASVSHVRHAMWPRAEHRVRVRRDDQAKDQAAVSSGSTCLPLPWIGLGRWRAAAFDGVVRQDRLKCVSRRLAAAALDRLADADPPVYG